jgi:hypothetical protein
MLIIIDTVAVFIITPPFPDVAVFSLFNIVMVSQVNLTQVR